MSSNYYTPIGGLGINHLGQAAENMSAPSNGAMTTWQPHPAFRYAYTALSVAGTASGAYHGYKRNRGSVGWAIGWGLLGGIFPFITIPVSLAQGFGKPKVSSNRRRRRRRTSRRRR